MSSSDDFRPLHFQSRVFEGTPHTRYRVYRDARNFITVDATSAAEAFRLSAIENPYHIICESLLMRQNVLSGDLLVTPEARTAIETQRKEQEAALAVASARRQAMTGTPEEGKAAPERPAPTAEMAENPNLMPDASGALPAIETLPPPEEPQASAVPTESDGELKPDEVSRLLGESP